MNHRLKLEKGYHNGPTHSFRIRCKSILLKSEGKSAPQNSRNTRGACTYYLRMDKTL